MDIYKAEEAYRNDPAFHNLIEMLRTFIIKLEFTPSELREAAMFAYYLHEQTKPIEPIVINMQSRPNPKDARSYKL